MCWSFECFTQAISIHIKLIDLRHDFAWIFIVVALFCQFKLGNWHGSKFSPTRADNATKMFRSNRHNHVSNIFVQNKMIIKKHLFLSLVLVSNERTNKQLAIPLTNFILIWLLVPQAIDTIHFGFSPPQLSSAHQDEARCFLWIEECRLLRQQRRQVTTGNYSPSQSIDIVMHANGKRWKRRCARAKLIWFKLAIKLISPEVRKPICFAESVGAKERRNVVIPLRLNSHSAALVS